MTPKPSLLVAALAPVEQVVARLGVRRRIEIETTPCLRLRRLVAGEEVRHEIHHVLELHVDLLEVFVELCILLVFAARGGRVAFARIILVFAAHFHLNDEVSKLL